MGDAKYVVHDGRRWRELDLRSGCVWGWGAVSFACARRGQLVPVSRARVLRALRARAAGDPGLCAVKDGPPLPEIRNLRPGRKSNDRRTPKRKRTARRMTDPPLHTTHQYNSQEVLSCSTDVNFDSSILKPWNRERVTTGVQTTCTTQSVGVQATWATKPVGLQATWATTPLDVQATWDTKPVGVQTENNWQRKTEELRNGDGRDGMTDNHGSEESRKEALLGRKEQLQDPLFRKHLLITEQEVTWLRKFLVKDNVLGADLKKFDFDDMYKAQLLYRLNPIVDAERCPRIARMLREKTSRTDATQRPRSVAGTSAGRSRYYSSSTGVHCWT